MQVLIVDDEAYAVEALIKRIDWSSFGFDATLSARSMAQAQAVFLETGVDLMLCDIEMPGEDGLSLIRWIRERGYDIDCILLTCHEDFAYAKEAISLKCQEYIVLPAAYEDIGDTVARIALKRQERFDANKLQEYGKNWLLQQQKQLKTQDQSKKPTRQEVVAECALYIQAHLGDENLNVNEIGAHFYMNPVYLSRIFKQEKGVSINQWIIAKRMELARELLKDPNLTAVAVANHCGYYNYPYFSTVFKKYYGYAPSQSLGQDRDPTEN